MTAMTDTSNGRLYIVSTPIGNLDDISRRAVECLGNAGLVACEDTRHTGLMLSRLGIKNKLISYHNFNENSRSSTIVDNLERGIDVALVSDAGTPGISDPAYRVVRAAVEGGYEVLAVPGPSSLLAALVISGLPLDRFVFEGFLPPKGAKRLKRIEALAEETRTMVFFESPHRIVPLLETIRDILGEREVSVSRELTKMYEETVRGSVSEIIQKLEDSRRRGEYTVVVRGLPRKVKR